MPEPGEPAAESYPSPLPLVVVGIPVPADYGDVETGGGRLAVGIAEPALQVHMFGKHAPGSGAEPLIGYGNGWIG